MSSTPPPRAPADSSEGPRVILPDQAARTLIETALDRNLLVEAGAGSGKTTALVGRMVALVRDRGVPIERIAAVTFTRKAAGELRQRFQDELETARKRAAARAGAHAPGSAEAGEARQEHDRLDVALRSVDRAFMGTIHAFCARLLRERPLEAGLDPAFKELTAGDGPLLAGTWWSEWLERLANQGDPVLAELETIGLQPHQLRHTFELLGEYSDVDFPLPGVPRPEPAEIAAVRAELEALMESAERIWPDEEPALGWGPMQSALRTAWFYRRTLDWSDDLAFLEVLARVQPKAEHLNLSRWIPDRKAQGPIKDLREAFRAWAGEGSRAARVLRQWLAHRYPIALGFALRAATEFRRFRRRTGQLTFHDLLALAAELLRRPPARGGGGARRDLGRRYRYVLVDEFQDTDPLQAEVLFLLASEPGAEREGDGDDGPEAEADWRRAVPRPGALFVVGDPKQSIYRFRRADIALYQQVRRRFDPARGGFGEVVTLTANFRSRPPVAELVNAVFDAPERFPAESDEHQAAFAPLEPVRDDSHPAEGVYVYDIPPTKNEAFRGRAKERPERETEARALAAWIAARVRDGERQAGDFLILARAKRALSGYARALEARNLAVQVSGAGVGVEEELGELEAVLGALTDPGDPVRTVAALTGLFFGLDLDQLLRHRERLAGDEHRHENPFDFRGADEVEAAAYGDLARVDAVEAALGTLHRWWKWARREPADVVVAELADELGLLPYAAAGELGQVRAGALSFALDAVRAAGLAGDTSLLGALDALQSVVAGTDTEVEAPLEPGREDAVRVMNLHKAKGLESPVVVLADPYRLSVHKPRFVVERAPDGPVTGWIRIGEPGAFRSFSELAQPLGWEDKEAAEQVFERAEETRLLYVAATRAADELVVTRCGDAKRAGRSPWAPFHDWLDEQGTKLDLEATEPGPRDRLEVGVEEIARRVAVVVSRREAAGEPAYAFDTVTALVRREAAAEGGDSAEDEVSEGNDAVEVGEERLDYELSEADSSGPGGFEWGSAVHATLEAAARGLTGDSLRAASRMALLENDRPLRNGEPVELDTLLGLVEKVRQSELWQRAEKAEIRLAEQPFVLEQEDGRFLEGVIDLVFKEDDGWVVVDWKTTSREGPPDEELAARYQEQVRWYGAAWHEATGEEVKEAVVGWVRGGKGQPSP